MKTNKYFPYDSKENVLKSIKYLKDKLAKASTDFDKFYLGMRIKDLEKLAEV